ncbi:hypothetical protein H9P43_004157 [Blastocladiella emersonii ATCC 22665]|nr:hypothetical protein H9P43_004157 [Blastocladiella emersonii ATCC 22665]
MNEPVPLITVVANDSDNKAPHFGVNQKAIDLLAAVDGPIGVVTIAGLYRTGKSYVLNRLAGSNRGFDVGSRVEPCTQGIYMWIVPQPPPELAALMKNSAMTIVLLDTEGLGSFTKSKTYDVKMFSLAVLLSSLFLYNSMGSIDESALDRLSLVAELSNHIRLQQADGEAGDRPADAYALNKFFPKFAWLVRDFGLKLELDGRAITSDEYLESVLNPIEGDSDKLRTRNLIRESIKTYFPDRRCFTLKRPVSDEKLLQRLDTLTEAEIRPQFLDQMRKVTEFVYATVMPKQLFGRTLTGANLAHLVAAYVRAMNDGGMPVIRSAWENVVSAECDRFLATATRRWDEAWRVKVADALPLADDALTARFWDVHDTCVDELRAFILDKQVGEPTAGAIAAKVNAWIKKSLAAAHEANHNKSARLCDEALQRVHAKLVAVVNEPDAGVDRFEAELSLALNEDYLPAALGPAKHASLSDFLTKRVLVLAKSIHTRNWTRRESEVAAATRERTEAADRDRAAAEALLRDVQANFLKSREEVAQLVAENQALINVVAKFSSVIDDEDMPPRKTPNGSAPSSPARATAAARVPAATAPETVSESPAVPAPAAAKPVTAAASSPVPVLAAKPTPSTTPAASSATAITSAALGKVLGSSWKPKAKGPKV